MAPDKLVYMANQIGTFFASQRGDMAVVGISTHLIKFWDPRMREKILVHLDNGGEGLDDAVRLAVAAIRPAAIETRTSPVASP